MHAIYAILLPPDGEPEDILGEAEDLVRQIAGERNRYSLIGLVLPDRTIVAPDPDCFPVSDRWNIHDLAGRISGYWLDFVAGLEYQEVAEALAPCSSGTEATWQLIEQDDKEAAIRALANLAADPEREKRHRQRAAQCLVRTLADGWPFPEWVGAQYGQRVFKHCGVAPEEAAIVLVDIHT